MNGGFVEFERPPGSVDIMQLVLAEYALSAAYDKHDVAPLVERLRTADHLFPEERALAADIIGGTWKPTRVPHRPALAPEVRRMKSWYLVLCVACEMSKGTPRKAAVVDVASQRGISVSKVQKAILEHEDTFRSLCGNKA